jgi:DNA-binding beta-propeller fold protein YncE
MGDSPIGISINPSLNMVYVTNLDSKSLSVIDSIEKELQRRYNSTNLFMV